MFGDEDGEADESDDVETLGESGIEDPAAGLDTTLDPPSIEADVTEDATDEEASAGSSDDVDADVYAGFWKLVVVIDVALAALSLGPMFIYFEGDWDTGAPLVALGVISLVYAVGKYRAFPDPDE